MYRILLGTCFLHVLFSCNFKEEKQPESQEIHSNDTFKKTVTHLNLNNAELEVLEFGDKAVGKYVLLVHLPDKEIFETETGPINGTIEQVFKKDLDQDSLPEIILETVSQGTGSYRNLIIYELHPNGLQQIDFPKLSFDLEPQYGGNDTFYVKQDTLFRRFQGNKMESQAGAAGPNIMVQYKMVNDSLKVLTRH